jgi:hypothetical protein
MCLVFAKVDEENDQTKDPRELIERMIESVGDYNNLKSLQDVHYWYTRRDNSSGREDVPIERYVFDGELS